MDSTITKALTNLRNARQRIEDGKAREAHLYETDLPAAEKNAVDIAAAERSLPHLQKILRDAIEKRESVVTREQREVGDKIRAKKAAEHQLTVDAWPRALDELERFLRSAHAWTLDTLLACGGSLAKMRAQVDATVTRHANDANEIPVPPDLQAEQLRIDAELTELENALKEA